MSDEPTTPTNVRFEDLGGGLTTEMISNQIQIFYDPTQQTARAIFNSTPYLKVGSNYRALQTDNNILEVDFTSQMAKFYGEHAEVLTDPVSGMDLKQVSVAGMMTLFKVAFDVEFNKREAERLAAIAQAQVIAAAAQAQTEALNVAYALQETAVESPSEDGTTCSFDSQTSGLTVDFTDTSIAGAGLTVTEHTWIFGDGSSSTEQNPIHEYPQNGTYTVTKLTTDSTGVVIRKTANLSVSTTSP